MTAPDEARLRIWVGGREILVADGQSVAAALLNAGISVLRHTYSSGSPRGLFCGIGACFDCVMEIDGRPGLRACLEPVRAEMRIVLTPEHADG